MIFKNTKNTKLLKHTIKLHLKTQENHIISHELHYNFKT